MLPVKLNRNINASSFFIYCHKPLVGSGGDGERRLWHVRQGTEHARKQREAEEAAAHEDLRVSGLVCIWSKKDRNPQSEVEAVQDNTSSNSI